MVSEKAYAAIDLKSFYASVECVERRMDTLTTNLVVADESRTAKTICLAATPALKSYGVPGRSRLFEVIQKVKEINYHRRIKAPNHKFSGKSADITELNQNPALAMDYIVAKPRMALYLQYSAKIYGIYLRYIAAEDIHSYSVDEVFMDLTPYLKTYRMTARELALKIINEVFRETGIVATAGIGTNLYLAKIAMDIMAKKMPSDKDGARIAELDEMSYRKQLWDHTPITDFWRVGRGYAKKLREHGIYTMGDVARCSVGKPEDYFNEELIYKMFGVNAQLLIDHAWGWEPCTIKDIKNYRPMYSSISSGQVLQHAYTHEKARLIVWEMTDMLVLNLVEKRLVTDQIVLDIGYDIENMKSYKGEIHRDHYGRNVPKPAHGSVNLGEHRSSTKYILDKVLALYERITFPNLLVRRVTVTANHVLPESCREKTTNKPVQLDLFTDYEYIVQSEVAAQKEAEKEKALQHTVIDIKNKFGKNAIIKAASLQAGAMTVERNQQIGGHKA